MTEAGKTSLGDFLKKTQEAAPVEAAAVATEEVGQPTVVQTPGKPDEPAVLEKWDTTGGDAPSSPETTEPEPYYKQLAKKVGLDVKDEDELVSKLKADPFEGVPTNLKKAVEFAKNGGDFLQLLKVNQIDYEGLDAAQLYEADVLAKAPDKEAAREYLDGLNPIQKVIEGTNLKQRLIAQQRMQEQDLIGALDREQKAKDQLRQTSLQAMTEVLDKTDAIEVAGYKLKLEGKHKKQIAQSMAASEFWNDSRYQTPKGYDIQQKIQHEFLINNWNTVQQFLQDRVKTSTLREVQQEVQNVDLERNTGRQVVETKTPPIFERIKFRR